MRNVALSLLRRSQRRQKKQGTSYGFAVGGIFLQEATKTGILRGARREGMSNHGLRSEKLCSAGLRTGVD